MRQETKLIWLAAFVHCGCVGPAGPAGFPGEPGAQGAPGRPGEDGEDGIDGYAPKGWVFCNGLLDLLGPNGTPDGVTELLLSYTLQSWTNGDLEVDCSVGIGSASDSSDRHYYPVVTAGAADGSCFASGDLPPTPAGINNVGFWTFQISPDGPFATYSDDDPGHPFDGYTYRFNAQDDCAGYKFDGTEWGPNMLDW